MRLVGMDVLVSAMWSLHLSVSSEHFSLLSLLHNYVCGDACVQL